MRIVENEVAGQLFGGADVGEGAAVGGLDADEGDAGDRAHGADGLIGAGDVGLGGGAGGGGGDDGGGGEEGVALSTCVTGGLEPGADAEDHDEGEADRRGDEQEELGADGDRLLGHGPW